VAQVIRKRWFDHWSVVWSWVLVCGLGIPLVLARAAALPRSVAATLLVALVLLASVPVIVMRRVNKRTARELKDLRNRMVAEGEGRDLPPNGR
jgi:hypothetical protein